MRCSCQRRFVVGQRAWPLIDPDMIVRSDIQASDLSDDPAVRKLLWPAGISDEAWHSGGRRHTVYARTLRKPLENASRGKSLGVGLRRLCLASRADERSQQRYIDGKLFRLLHGNLHTHNHDD